MPYSSNNTVSYFVPISLHIFICHIDITIYYKFVTSVMGSKISYIMFSTGLVLIEQATSPEASINDKTVANR